MITSPKTKFIDFYDDQIKEKLFFFIWYRFSRIIHDVDFIFDIIFKKKTNSTLNGRENQYKLKRKNLWKNIHFNHY